ncbi:MAG: hypothetical protein O8C61_03760, partial [Candidatus Methanoperedens sp.]|nr:hypothetical protein [Candidatus Methanoperedens sp.]
MQETEIAEDDTQIQPDQPVEETAEEVTDEAVEEEPKEEPRKVLPGDLIGTSEEFIPRNGAYLEGGNIHAASTGIVNINK